MTTIRCRRARATAHSNIALVKYWGKRPSSVPDLNLPAVGSLSMTLDGLRTETVVDATASDTDSASLAGEALSGAFADKVFAHLDRVWNFAYPQTTRPRCRVETVNFLPTAAGLASSASGFAALTVAAAAAFGIEQDRFALANLARRGSGSAARSIWGGFVSLERGSAEDGSDCRAYPLYDRGHWDLRLIIVHTATGQKPVGSTGGMNRCSETSPYYAPWVDSSEADLEAARKALAARDLDALGATMEHSCFKMHACMLATRPPLVYWNGATLDVIRMVWEARASGLTGYVTSDAGPHVKVLCRASDAEELAARLRQVSGVVRVDAVAPGPDAEAVVES